MTCNGNAGKIATVPLKPQNETYSKNRLDRQDWIDAAFKILVSHGEEQVRILKLADTLGVTRGSFYWHFKDRQDLLRELLGYWAAKNTQGIVDQAGKPAPSITGAILNVFWLWTQDDLFDPRLDFAVREWARRSADVHKVVDEADRCRVAALTAMYERHGYCGQDAFIRARVLYYMQLGYYALEVSEPMDVRLSYIADYIRSFSGREPDMALVAEFCDAVAARSVRKAPGT